MIPSDDEDNSRPQATEGGPEPESASSLESETGRSLEPEILPPEEVNRAAKAIAMFKGRSGPLPSPEELARYGEVDPELPGVIVSQWTSETKFRREMARKEFDLNRELQVGLLAAHQRNSMLGLVLGFVLVIVATIGGIWLVSNGQDVTGLAVFFGGLATLVGTYVWGHRAREKALVHPRRDGDAENSKEPA